MIRCVSGAHAPRFRGELQLLVIRLRTHLHLHEYHGARLAALVSAAGTPRCRFPRPSMTPTRLQGSMHNA